MGCDGLRWDLLGRVHALFGGGGWAWASVVVGCGGWWWDWRKERCWDARRARGREALFDRRPLTRLVAIASAARKATSHSRRPSYRGNATLYSGPLELSCIHYSSTRVVFYSPKLDGSSGEGDLGKRLLEHLALDGRNLELELRGLTAAVAGREGARAPRGTWSPGQHTSI